MMVKMIDAGMDVACLNFAVGDQKVRSQFKLIQIITAYYNRRKEHALITSEMLLSRGLIVSVPR